MAQVNSADSKRSPRTQTGPESLPDDSPADLCLASTSDTHELSKPLGPRRPNGSLGILVSVADFPERTAHRGCEEQGRPSRGRRRAGRSGYMITSSALEPERPGRSSGSSTERAGTYLWISNRRMHLYRQKKNPKLGSTVTSRSDLTNLRPTRDQRTALGDASLSAPCSGCPESPHPQHAGFPCLSGFARAVPTARNALPVLSSLHLPLSKLVNCSVPQLPCKLGEY